MTKPRKTTDEERAEAERLGEQPQPVDPETQRRQGHRSSAGRGKPEPDTEKA